jgi:hypothetical protein
VEFEPMAAPPPIVKGRHVVVLAVEVDARRVLIRDPTYIQQRRSGCVAIRVPDQKIYICHRALGDGRINGNAQRRTLEQEHIYTARVKRHQRLLQAPSQIQHVKVANHPLPPELFARGSRNICGRDTR